MPKVLESHTQPDLFGGESTVCVLSKDAAARSDEERKLLSETRFAKHFSCSTLFAELAQPEIEVNDDDYEGKANPELDAMLRITNADIESCTDKVLETFVFELHRACLEQNLAFLTSEDEKPRVLKEKGYILQWVFCVDLVRGRHQSQIQFSFLNCCLASGVNPDHFRGQLLQLEVVRDLLVRLHLVEKHKLPPLRRKVMYDDLCTLPQTRPGHDVAIAGV